MQTVKRRFFAMRNGVIADVLRRGGSPFRIIFGLNLPQIVEIGNDMGRNRELAEQLWANATTRESMLLAPMLVEPETFTYADAEHWIAGIPAAEVADILCHRLLRHCAYAPQLADSLVQSATPMDRYVAVRLMFNLVAAHPQQALDIARRAQAHPSSLTDRTAAMLAEEAGFILE